MNLVRTAIKELPDEQQTIIIMKFVEDLTNKEIAAALGKSEGGVKTAQHRSIQNIKKKIINGKYNQKIKESAKLRRMRIIASDPNWFVSLRAHFSRNKPGF